jgi:hypothetical protein
MKLLLTLTTIIEAVAGLALLGIPSATVSLLLGSGLDTPAAVAIGRLAGVALCALGLACWLVRSGLQSCEARGIITAVTFYNFGAVAILSFAGTQLNPVGIALWPAVVLHAAMTVWCLTGLLCKPA